ncbi:MAG: flippase-like domain-containing protein [Deltaproteobacteria bacterium]|nr:flippase-like domain-containing protein [bacterium]MCB9477925.1 flippase-like domain-containing protein [Deltaproteobacteria bacterium]MCB9488196.1 flippase-like domain-containing protein [Deltaproteobacteria bacterium]
MKSWKTWVGVLVSVLFCYLAFRNIDWRVLGGKLAEIRMAPLLVVAVLVAVMLMVRGYRWSLFLKPIKPVSWWVLFWSSALGYALNNILPARLGEIARAHSAHKQGGVAFGSAFGTLVVERLYDMFSALFMFVAALMIADFGNFEQVFGVSQNKIALIMGAGGLVIVTAVVLLKWQNELGVRILRFFLRVLPEKWAEKIVELFQAFVKGLTQSTKPLDVVMILACSAFIWIVSTYTMYLCVSAFDIRISLDTSIIVMMAVIIAVAIPAAPGYVGVYQYTLKLALVHYVGLDDETALSIAIVIHAANYIPQTLLGLARFAYEGLSVSEISHVKEEMNEAP